jgi:AbiA family abortive infection protein
MQSTPAALGHFLQYKYWQDAHTLLENQLSQIGRNKHFNQLGIFYCLDIKSNFPNIVNDMKQYEYFTQKIQTNLFYLLEKEFSIFPYEVPKGWIQVRQYRFMTYPLRILYYAIGLYILDVTSKYVSDRRKEYTQVQSFYGGDIEYRNGQLEAQHKRIYYRNYYSRFRNAVIAASKPKEGKFVLRLDIQNYYDSLSIRHLVEQILSKVQEKVRKEKQFDETTCQLICDFFWHIMKGNNGIPQMDGDIISNYLGHLYLFFHDIELLEILEEEKKSGRIGDYQILRYVDDTYIIFEPRGNSYDVDSLTYKIGDLLAGKTSLRYGDKNKPFNLKKPDDYEEFEQSLKKVSHATEVADPNDRPEVAATNLLKALREYQKRDEAVVETYSRRRNKNITDEGLSSVNRKDVLAILRRPDMQQEILNILHDFDFERVFLSPENLIILIINLDDGLKNNFRNWLLNREINSTRYAHLVLVYTAKTRDSSYDWDVFLLLEKYEKLRPLVEHIKKPDLYTDQGYYSLTSLQIKKICRFHNVIEQARLRMEDEIRGDWNNSVLHLLNELHAACKYIINSDEINNQSVRTLLEVNGLHIDVRETIDDLHSARNHNPSAHAEQDTMDKDRYERFKKAVGECLRIIIPESTDAP